jgi:hypothetical protein
MAVPRHACQGGLAGEGADFLIGAMARRDEERAKRLAEALRENLKRRKAQARGESSAPGILPEGEGDRPKPGGEADGDQGRSGRDGNVPLP